MKKVLKISTWTIITVICFTVIYIVGLFAGLPIIPWIETNYYDQQTNHRLGDGIVITQPTNTTIRLEIPDYFPENDQCIDIWFTKAGQQSNVVVNSFSISAIDNNNKEIKKEKIYLFGNDNSRFNGLEIEDFTTIQTDTNYQNKFRFIRTVYNFDDIKEVTFKIKTLYQTDNIADSLMTSLTIEKIRKLTWNEFRVH